jgi:hypothetical protein
MVVKGATRQPRADRHHEKRLHIDIVGFEEQLNKRALQPLVLIFGERAEEAWARALAYVSDKDGVVEIHPKALSEIMPPPAADEIETLYWSFVEEVEEAFRVDRWAWLTDNLVRDLMPLEFYEGGHAFVRSVTGAAWPDRYPELNAQFENLADRVEEYLRHFDMRSYFQGDWARQDKHYKAIFPNPHYDEEWRSAQAWEKGEPEPPLERDRGPEQAVRGREETPEGDLPAPGRQARDSRPDGRHQQAEVHHLLPGRIHRPRPEAEAGEQAEPMITPHNEKAPAAFLTTRALADLSAYPWSSVICLSGGTSLRASRR